MHQISNSRRELDEATTKRLQSTGVVTVLVRRVKNIRTSVSGRRARSVQDQLSKLGRVPEKAVQDLALSHYRRFVNLASFVAYRLTTYSVGQLMREKGIRTLSYTDVNSKGDKHAIAIYNFKY